MIYTAKLIHHKGTRLSYTRDSLISDFLRTHKDVLNFSVDLKEYTFDEFPDWIELVAFIGQEYRNKCGELYWCGTKYDSVNDLVYALKDQKNILQIIVKYDEN